MRRLDILLVGQSRALTDLAQELENTAMHCPG